MRLLPEIVKKCDFSNIRYAQCWEDADTLLKGLCLNRSFNGLAIASGGENVLSMLSHYPNKVIALDVSPAQIACLELKVAAFRVLKYPEVLELIGSRPSNRRHQLLQRCRPLLSMESKDFWDARTDQVEKGIGSIGKFEEYLTLVRRWILPMIHSQCRLGQLLSGGSQETRQLFYDHVWNNWRWRILFRIFSSRFILGKKARDPSFFKYSDRGSTRQLLDRVRNGLVNQEPSENPYLHWAIKGTHNDVLPHALRQENFHDIRVNLDNLEWRCCSLEEYIETAEDNQIDCFNLSNVFEYMSLGNYHNLLKRLVRVGRKGGRLVYWNFLVERHSPLFLSHCLRSLKSLADKLHQENKTFLHQAIRIEEIVKV